MGLRFTILSSGSTGNATVVQNEDVKLLVDAGLSAKRIELLMSERDTFGRELSGILVTHEHSDHIKGLGAMARKFDLPVYANERTWEEMDKHIGKISEQNRKVMTTGSKIDFGTMEVESYGISHDAVEPVGFCFYDGQSKLGLATDLGYVSDKVKDKICDCDVLVLESNHDVEMLHVGRYPWNIKRRILSDTGHLSNEAAGDALCDIIAGQTKRVYLAHLSREHNMIDLARMTVHNVLESSGLAARKQHFRLMDTYYDRPTLWDDVSEK